MARGFIVLTQPKVDLLLAESIASREQELAAYDIEHDGHVAAITALGSISWEDSDGTYKKYRGMARDQMIAMALRDGLTAANIQAISNLNALDQHKVGQLAVVVERDESERHYANATGKLPAGARRDAAIAAHLAKQAALEARTR